MTSVSVGKHSFHLFTRPSFIEGVGRLVDVTGALNTYAYRKTDAQADADAIESDWKAVGDDIRTAMTEYERSQGGRKKK